MDGPAEGWADPLGEYFSRLGFIIDGGGFGHYAALGEYAQTFEMNEWVRFDEPGVYRCYCSTSRVQADDKKDQRLLVVSQVIEFEITPADSSFVQGTLAQAQRDVKNDKLRAQAVRTLRFLATPEAVEVLAGLANDPEIAQEAMFGLIGVRDRAKALQTLRKSWTILTWRSMIRSRPPWWNCRFRLRTCPRSRRAGRGKKTMHSRSQRWSKRRPAWRRNWRPMSPRDCGVNAGGRWPRRVAHLLFNAKIDNPQLRRGLAENFSLFTRDERCSILEDRFWPLAKCPEFEPVLAQIVDHPLAHEQWYAVSEQSLAVLRYGEFQPQKARSLILSDIRQPCPNLARTAALSLPTEALPLDFQSVLLKNLTARPESDVEKVAGLIEHYGTKAILPGVVTYYRRYEGRWACGIEESFLRFWIEHDRPAGLEALMRVARSRETGCYKTVLENTLRHNWRNDLQKILLPLLDDPSADLAAQSAKLLQEDGDNQCVEPLIAALAGRPATTQRAKTDDRDQSAARYAIVSALAEGKRFRLTPEQRIRIVGLLKTEDEKIQFPTSMPTSRSGD